MPSDDLEFFVFDQQKMEQIDIVELTELAEEIELSEQEAAAIDEIIYNINHVKDPLYVYLRNSEMTSSLNLKGELERVIMLKLRIWNGILGILVSSDNDFIPVETDRVLPAKLAPLLFWAGVAERFPHFAGIPYMRDIIYEICWLLREKDNVPYNLIGNIERNLHGVDLSVLRLYDALITDKYYLKQLIRDDQPIKLIIEKDADPAYVELFLRLSEKSLDENFGRPVIIGCADTRMFFLDFFHQIFEYSQPELTDMNAITWQHWRNAYGKFFQRPYWNEYHIPRYLPTARPLAIRGISGVGKSHLGRHLLHKPTRFYTLRVYIDASVNLEQQIRDMIPMMMKNGQTLIVYDNVSNLSVLPVLDAEYIILPIDSGVNVSCKVYDLPMFTTEESVQLLQEITAQSADMKEVATTLHNWPLAIISDMKEVATTLHNWPLAIISAALYMYRTSNTPSRYLYLLLHYMREVLSKDMRELRHENIYATLLNMPENERPLLFMKENK